MSPSHCQDSDNEERRSMCTYHGGMQKDISWLIKIGYGVFVVGLGVMVLGITTIFYAGGLTQKIESLSIQSMSFEHRLDAIERTQNQFQRSYTSHSSSK